MFSSICPCIKSKRSNSVEVVKESGNPRNKTALKPGRSLMDWIRLTNSGKDLAGNGGMPWEVSLSELAKHNKKNDAWMAIRGNVYNVTSYMEFHPGGEDELMRGIGMDATELFDEVHRWVNYESMLKKCLVGPLKSSPAKILNQRNGSVPAPPLLLQPKNGSAPAPLLAVQPKSQQPVVTHDWIQTANHVTLILYTRQKNLEEKNLNSTVTPSCFKLTLDTDSSAVVEISVKFSQNIKAEISSQKLHKNTGKIEVTFPKAEEKTWTLIGTVDVKKLENFQRVKITDKINLNHNVRLFAIEKPGNYPEMPIGWHLQLRVDNIDYARSYTPVLKSFGNEEDEQSLHLMVKVYDSGKLTSSLDKLKVGDSVLISSPLGSFVSSRLDGCEYLLALAAGSGITPMIKVIDKVILLKKCAKLLFFNKEQRDIVWRSEFERLSQSSDSRFEVVHILSNADPEWTGPRGRISATFLSENVRTACEKFYVCVCGPTEFTMEALRLLKDLGFSEEQMHAFIG